jgi:folate-binding protein YgfZ
MADHDSVSVSVVRENGAHARRHGDGGKILVAAHRELAVPGFDVYVEQAAAGWLRDRLLRAGGVEGDERAWDVLRLEAGTPVFGRDMDEDTIPLEAGIQDQAISFTKGCYVGQEIIVRVMHRGHGRVARRLVGLLPAGRDAESAALSTPEGDLVPGDVVRTRDGERELGRITSAAFSPSVGSSIALGYVQRDFAAAGTEVAVRRGQTLVPLSVTEPPFVRG